MQLDKQLVYSYEELYAWEILYTAVVTPVSQSEHKKCSIFAGQGASDALSAGSVENDALGDGGTYKSACDTVLPIPATIPFTYF